MNPVRYFKCVVEIELSSGKVNYTTIKEETILQFVLKAHAQSIQRISQTPKTVDAIVLSRSWKLYGIFIKKDNG